MNDERADILISKVIDGSASDAEWAELAARAEAKPVIWRDLAESQRHQHVLSRTMNEAVAVAERVAVPTRMQAGPQEGVLAPRRTNAGAWSGWAVAAVIALAALANRIGMKAEMGDLQQGNGGVQTAGWTNPDEALNAYLDLGRKEGKVVGELPSKLIVSTRANPNGAGYEVICVQQIVVREIVPTLYEVTGENDQGKVSLVPFKPEPTGF